MKCLTWYKRVTPTLYNIIWLSPIPPCMYFFFRVFYAFDYQYVSIFFPSFFHLTVFIFVVILSVFDSFSDIFTFKLFNVYVFAMVLNILIFFKVFARVNIFCYFLGQILLFLWYIFVVFTIFIVFCIVIFTSFWQIFILILHFNICAMFFCLFIVFLVNCNLYALI